MLDRKGGLVPVVRIAGSALPGTSPVHWRAMTRRGDYLIGLAAYGAPDSIVTGAAGADVLRSLAEGITRTAPGTAARAAISLSTSGLFD